MVMTCKILRMGDLVMVLKGEGQGHTKCITMSDRPSEMFVYLCLTSRSLCFCEHDIAGHE